MYVKVENAPYVRDTESNAILNVDEHAKNEYFAKVRMIQAQKQEVNKLQSEIDSVKTELHDIKQLLLHLLDKKDNG